MDCNVLITMAGRGQRFRDAGHAHPKHAIEVGGRSLFDWAMASLANFLTPGARLIFATLAGHGAAAFLRARRATFPTDDIHVRELKRVTDGQASTAYACRDLWRPAAPLLVYNIDTYVEPAWLSPAHIPPGADGWIPCAKLAGDHWSFARPGADGWVREVAEKRRISEHCSIGLYWFARPADFANAHAHTLAERQGRGGERYVAPLYEWLIRANRKVAISAVPAERVHALGTPAELAAFAPGRRSQEAR